MIDAAAVLLVAGLDPMALLRATDDVEVAAMTAVAERALKLERERTEARDHNLAVMVGNNVGSIVARALGARVG